MGRPGGVSGLGTVVRTAALAMLPVDRVPKVFAALNAGTREAAMATGSPVSGLRLRHGARLRQ